MGQLVDGFPKWHKGTCRIPELCRTLWGWLKHTKTTSRTNTMKLSNSFPPADAAVEYLKKIDYKKHWNNFVTLILFIAAVSYVLAQKVHQWWKNGGQESTIQLLQKIQNILQVCYTWAVTEAFPWVKNTYKKAQETYKNWEALVTVA